MSTPTELRQPANFLRNTLSAFVRGEHYEIAPDKPDMQLLKDIVRGRNLGGLFHACHKNNPLPQPLLKKWLQMKMVAAMHNHAMEKVAANITALTEKAGIRVAAMRGIVLAQTLYKDPALRPMHDIDLLVRPSDRETFLDAMEAAGHKPVEYLRSQYVFEIDRVTVEVHWQLLSNKRYRSVIDSNELVSSAIKTDTPSGHVYRLADKWELIGLVVHAFTHHNLGQIFSLVDIGLVMHNRDIDWQEIAHWSKQAGISRMMALTLGFVNHLFGLGLEEKVMRYFAPDDTTSEKYYKYYQEQTLAKITMTTHLGVKQSQFYVAESWANKARELLRLFSAKEMRFILNLIAAKVFGKKQKMESG